MTGASACSVWLRENADSNFLKTPNIFTTLRISKIRLRANRKCPGLRFLKKSPTKEYTE